MIVERRRLGDVAVVMRCSRLWCCERPVYALVGPFVNATWLGFGLEGFGGPAAAGDAGGGGRTGALGRIGSGERARPCPLRHWIRGDGRALRPQGR